MPYQDSKISRSADLKVDEHGVARGTVVVRYLGEPARRWRATALTDDETSLKTALKSQMEGLLPAGMEIEVASVGELKDSEKSLVITYTVSGAVGTSTGKRLLLPTNLFEANTPAKFPGEKREVQVDMHYGSSTQDIVRYVVLDGFALDSPPDKDEATMKGAAAWGSRPVVDGKAITFYRELFVGRVLYSAEDYPVLREFYKKLEAKDHETLILTRMAVAPAGN